MIEIEIVYIRKIKDYHYLFKTIDKRDIVYYMIHAPELDNYDLYLYTFIINCYNDISYYSYHTVSIIDSNKISIDILCGITILLEEDVMNLMLQE